MMNAPPVKNKRPSRKHRRRPSNLLQDYARRQRNHIWLETHIWHAKRFHMVEKWGYKLPHFPNDKGHRACYRASVNKCMLWDMSYMCCIELEGQGDGLTSSLQRIMSPDAGLTAAAKYYIEGTREGSAVLYRCDSYPHHALGPCTFMWKPLAARPDEKCSSENHCLWLWVHPAMYTDVLEELSGVFNATLVTNEDTQVQDVDMGQADENAEKDSEVPAKEKKSNKAGKDKPLDKTEKAKLDNHVYVGSSVTIRSLKDTLCRLRLTGPAAQNILAHILQPACVGMGRKDATREEDMVTEDNDSGCEEGAACEKATIELQSSEKWWQTYYSDQAGVDVHSAQSQTWKTVSSQTSPASVTPHAVLGLTVRDPRLGLPLERNKSLPQATDRPADYDICAWQAEWSTSALWEEDVRASVKNTKKSEQEINKERSKLLVPGSKLDLGEEESRVPVILVQRPGLQPSDNKSGGRPGQGSGWDIILPGGWTMAFWIGLVYRGARVGGLKELQQVDVESGAFHFPNDFPDTPAGLEAEMSRKEQDEGKYNRMPPAKRPNYVKLGVKAPFHCPWKELVHEWAAQSKPGDPGSTSTSFCVLRSQKKLKELDTAVKTKEAHVDLGSEDSFMQSFVPIKLSMVGKGAPAPVSSICLPSENDLHQLTCDPKYGGPSESQHKDTVKPVINKKKVLTEALKETKDQDSDLNEEVEDIHLLSHCSRKAFGYMSEGGYQYTSGHGSGLGFVTLLGLDELLKEQKGRPGRLVLLVRPPTSLQYRFAYVQVVL